MSVTVKFIESDVHLPVWARVKLNGNVSIISKHEASNLSTSALPILNLTLQASNGVLYLIDTAITG